MIDNSEQIEKYLDFDSKNDYYTIDIIKRRKENPNMKHGYKTINYFVIDSFEKYQEVLPLVKKCCNDNNARGYFMLNKRDFKTTTIMMIKKLSSLLLNDNYKSSKSVFKSITKSYTSSKNKKWIVDVDYNENLRYQNDNYFDLISFIIELQSKTDKIPFMDIIHTKNGCHIITSPINLKEFKDKYPDIDVHKDNMTILYVP